MKSMNGANITNTKDDDMKILPQKVKTDISFFGIGKQVATGLVREIRDTAGQDDMSSSRVQIFLTGKQKIVDNLHHPSLLRPSGSKGRH